MKDRYENLDEYIADLRAALSQNDGCANHHYNLGVALLSLSLIHISEPTRP